MSSTERRHNKDRLELDCQTFKEAGNEEALSHAIQRLVETNKSKYDINQVKKIFADYLTKNERELYPSFHSGERSLYTYVLNHLKQLSGGRAAKLTFMCHEQWLDWNERDRKAWLEYAMNDIAHVFMDLYRKYDMQQSRIEEMMEKVKRCECEIEERRLKLEERLHEVESQRDQLIQDIKKYEAFVNYQVTRLNKVLQ